jgi:hypothetical protein
MNLATVGLSPPTSKLDPATLGDYVVHDFRDMFDNAGDSLPHSPGVYAFFIRRGAKLVKALGLSADDRPELGHPTGGYSHIYSGSAGSLQHRLRVHLLGNLQSSNLRHTLLASEHVHGALSATGVRLERTPNADLGLDRWLCDQAKVLWWETESYRDLERTLVRSTKSPLNITFNRRRAWPLVRMKQVYNEALLERTRTYYKPVNDSPITARS